ncbi:MAG: hypothetical protein ACJ8EB_10100 [Allosphingosinicella sp.]
MRDAMEARIWAEHGHDYASQVAGLFAAAGAAFRRLNAIQFDAPWERAGGRGAGRGAGQGGRLA